MAASWQRPPSAGAWSNGGGEHSPPPQCHEQKTSTHLESASALHRGAAASLLDQLELHGGTMVKANTCKVPDRGGGKHSPPPECQRQKTSTHLESAASVSHCGAAASLLHQSELHGGSAAKVNICRCLVAAAARTLHHRSARGTRRARTLSPPTPLPRTVKQLQACSVSRRCPPPPSTMEQLCACLVSRRCPAPPCIVKQW